MEFFARPFEVPERPFAALVFVWQADKVLVADIVGRGWCIPSGRLEPGETSERAARREAWEECGAQLGELHYIGCFQLPHGEGCRWAACYATTLADLGEFRVTSESRARRWVSMDELPDLYYLWNEVVKSVFALSRDTLAQQNDEPYS